MIQNLYIISNENLYLLNLVSHDYGSKFKRFPQIEARQISINLRMNRNMPNLPVQYDLFIQMSTCYI